MFPLEGPNRRPSAYPSATINVDFGASYRALRCQPRGDFTNISKDTITLVNARPGCGCTTPNFKPNEKIAPGKVGQVQITFNGSAMGTFSRATTLEFSNGLIKQTQFAGEGVAITNAPAAPIINSPNKQ